MAWSFQKRIKIAPGLQLNVGNKGMSARVGLRGAGVTVGKSGARASASIPRTGISYRKILSSGRQQIATMEMAETRSDDPPRKPSKIFGVVLVLVGLATGIALVDLL